MYGSLIRRYSLSADDRSVPVIKVVNVIQVQPRTIMSFDIYIYMSDLTSKTCCMLLVL